MLLDYQLKDARKSIKTELRELLKNCERISADSRAEYVRNMPQGSLVVPNQYLYTTQAGEEIEKATTKTRENIKAILDDLYLKIADDVTAPPSQDAVNTIQLLKMRSNISEQEFKCYADKYKDNALTVSLLNEIAREKELNIHIEPSRDMQLAENIEHYKGQLDKYINSYDAKRGGYDIASVCGLEHDCDNDLLRGEGEEE